MGHDKTARPTIRLLQNDLPEGWAQVEQFRAATHGQWDDLHPFAAVDHPIVRKAAESLGSDPAKDSTTQVVGCSGDLRLIEIKYSQWRAGVWTDQESGVRWIVKAGLAKGDHKDHDDFYEQVEQLIELGKGETIIPTEKDRLLLKRETFARELSKWEMEIQKQVTELLGAVLRGCSQRGDIRHPLKAEKIGTVEVTYDAIAEEDEGCEELVVDFLFQSKYVGSNLGWEAITRVLNSLCPPVQEWDRTWEIFSIIMEPGFCARQLERLAAANSDGRLIEAELGTASHYAHKRHIADSSIYGESIRALCGVYFVPSQDHKRLAVCPNCSGVRQKLPSH